MKLEESLRNVPKKLEKLVEMMVMALGETC
jgi:hypothetical protein